MPTHNGESPRGHTALRRTVEAALADSEPGPTLLGEAVAELLWRRGLRNAQRRRQLENAWQRVVGPDLAAQLRLGSWRRGVLEILSRDAALVHRLAQFDAPRLLEALQRELGPTQVTQLRFRLG